MKAYMAEFSKWMQGGLVGLVASIWQWLQAGHLSLASLGTLVGTAILVRVGGWIVKTYGPAPTV